MTSSWRWDSEDEFREWVHPHALNPVPRVRNSYTLFSFAQSARSLYKDLDELRVKLERLETLLKRNTKDPLVLAEARELAFYICHHGESILVFQKRLAQGKHAYGFLHAKEDIPHRAHSTHRPLALFDLRRLAIDTRKLLNGFEELELADVDFLVSGLRLPDALERDFRLARDLFSVGFDEVGLLIAGRGLEGVLRQILTERHISVRSRPAAEAVLNDLIEALKQLRWRTNGTPFLSRDAVQLLHWLRETRNIGAHTAERGTEPLGSPRELAVLIAQSAQRLWKIHETNRRRRIVMNAG